MVREFPVSPHGAPYRRCAVSVSMNRGESLMRICSICGCLLGAIVAVVLANVIDVAAQSYPSRPVRMLVPYPPGGGLDPIGRAIGQKFLESTGQSFVHDN